MSSPTNNNTNKPTTTTKPISILKNPSVNKEMNH
jgi:hypothetical protein